MISSLKILAVIPARGGSKRLPRKNLKLANGKPLIAYTIEGGKGSKYIDRLVVSTDDREIAEVAEAFGCDVPFMRPPELALDSTDGLSPILHALEQLPGYDLVLILQPTSPLRTSADIDACIELCVTQGANSCISVCEIDKKLEWMYFTDEHHRMSPVMKDVPSASLGRKTCVLNGAVYVYKTGWLLQSLKLIDVDTACYVMSKDHSLDIDTELDFKVFEALIDHI